MKKKMTRMQRTNSKAIYLSFFILHFSFMLSLSACSTLRGMSTDSLRAAATADSLIDYARLSLGKPYRYAGRGPASFDCSGFTSYVYAHFGYSLNHSSSGQMHQGRPVRKGIKHLQRGDLVFFSGRRISQTPGHVGIVIGLDPGGKSFTFIHAARTGVIISHLYEPYYEARYLGARRLLPDFAPGSASISPILTPTEPQIPIPTPLPPPDSISSFFLLQSSF
jgi:hypothetical protein